jgi:hypothetical protein
LGWTLSRAQSPARRSLGCSYAYESDGEGYRIVSLGADGREGGEGANRDISSSEERPHAARAGATQPTEDGGDASELQTAPGEARPQE